MTYHRYLTIGSLLRPTIAFAFFCLSLLGLAQIPGTVDVALYQAPAANTVEVRVRPNAQGIAGVVSGLTFTVRWNANSGASLGSISQNIDGNFCPLFRVGLSADPAGVQSVDGFNYLTYNAFGSATLTSCPTGPGYNWPADQETIIARIAVVPGTGCGRFQIVNDGYTGPNNKDLYVEVNGSDLSGSPYGSVVQVPNTSGGGCTDDCMGVPDGPALPGTPCDDGDPCTANDVYTAACQCRGTFEPSLCPVDIGLYPSAADPMVLELRVRPNGNSVDSLVSALTFTLRWETQSGLSFGAIDQTLDNTTFCPLLGIPLEADAIVQDGIYSYLTINGFGTSYLQDCVTQPGYNWPADAETVIMRLPVVPGNGCTDLGIINDAFTQANNRDYFISINGQERVGIIFSPVVTVGACAWYSQSSGTASDPIWSTIPIGTPGTANFGPGSNVVVQTSHTVTLDIDVTAKDLVLESGATLNMGTARKLSAHGQQVRLLGTVMPGTSELELLGNGDIDLELAGTIPLWDLSMRTPAPSRVEVTGALDIRGTLLLSEGEFDASAATVRMRSLSTGTTGRLGPVGNDASFLGEITMQRRIPDGVTNWRLLSSPVYGRTANDWDDDFITAGFPGSDYPSFDQPVGSGILWPSIRWYDEPNTGTNTNDGLLGVPDISYPLTPGQGFAVWCGDALGGTDAFMIDLTGEPVIAQQDLPLAMSWTSTGTPTADGWNLVGNPLPSPIAFAGVARGSDVLNQYHVFNPATGNNAAWNGFIGTNGANGTLQSSQAFWLKANGPDVVTTVNESSKVAGNTGGLFGRPQLLGGSIALVRLTISSTINDFTDETVVVFEQGSPTYNENESDVLQLVFGNPAAPQISALSSDGLPLSINMHGQYGQELNIPLLVDVAVSGTYTVTASDMDGISGLSCLVLEDLLTGSVTALDNGSTYSFAINANDPSDVPRLLLRASYSAPLLVTDASCAGTADGQAELSLDEGLAQVTWSHSNGTAIGSISDATGTLVIEGLAAGSYQITVTGAGECLQLQTAITIAEPFPLEALVNELQGASCPYSTDATISVEMLGGTAPYTYAWTDGSAGNTYVGGPGGTSLQVVDANGCTWTNSWTLPSGTAPDAAISAPSFALAGEPVVLVASPPMADSHQWTLGDGNTATGVEVVHSYALAGNYNVQLVVMDGACSDTAMVLLQVDQTTGLNGTVSTEALAWYANEHIVFVLPQDCVGSVTAELFDATGRIQWQGTLPCGTDRVLLRMTDIASGIWMVRLSNGTRWNTVRMPIMR